MSDQVVSTGTATSSEAAASEEVERQERSVSEVDESLKATEQMVAPIESEGLSETSESAERLFDAPKLAEMISSGDGISEDALNYTSNLLQDKLGLSDAEARGILYALAEGTNASNELAEMRVFGDVGGKQGFEELRQWAATGLSAEDLATYNQLSSNAKGLDDYKSAVKFLADKRGDRVGNAPNRTSGETPSESAIKPIRSRQELTRLMGDERYETEPAFREAVDRRFEEGVRLGVYSVDGRR